MIKDEDGGVNFLFDFVQWIALSLPQGLGMP